MTLSRLLSWRRRPSTITATRLVVLSGKSAPLVVHVVGRQVRSKTNVGRRSESALRGKSQGLHLYDDLRPNPQCPPRIHRRDLVGQGGEVDAAPLQSLEYAILFPAPQAASDPAQIGQSVRCRTADEHRAQPAGAAGLQAPAAGHYRSRRAMGKLQPVGAAAPGTVSGRQSLADDTLQPLFQRCRL